MKTATTLTLLTGFLLFSFASLSGTVKEDVDKMFKSLKWYGHASFAIESDKIIYFDPWKIPGSAPKADLILVTHSHFDHFSPKDVNLLKKEETTIICSSDCASRVPGDVRGLAPGQEIEVLGIKIKAVPSYNPSKPFHPRKNKWLGYIITVKGVSVYHAGDTDFIPGMLQLGQVDVALLPSGDTYTMDNPEAAEAAISINPKIAIPMHRWSTKPEEFREKVEANSNVRVLLLREGEEHQLT